MRSFYCIAANYMSGAKADAILSRSTDPKLRRKKKRPVDEDGNALDNGVGGSGMIILDQEDDWRTTKRRGEEEELDGAPGKSLI